MDLLTSLIVASVANAAILAVLGFLARSLIKSLLAKDLEKFKFELKSTSDTAIERLKSDLQRAAFEHQVRFSKLHEKRAEVIAELYKHLVGALRATEDFVRPLVGEPSRREKYDPAMNKIEECDRFLDQHKIYLPDSLCNKLEELLKKLRRPANEVGVYGRIEDPSPDTLNKKWKILEQAWESVKQDIPPLRQDLEQEFRKILGPDSEMTQSTQGSPTASR